MSERDFTGPPSERPRLLRSAATTYAARVAFSVLSFASVLITARALGADGRGSVAFLTMMGYLTAQLATLGIFQADANIAAREPQLTRRLAGTSLGLAALFGVTAAGIVALLIALFPAVGADSDPELIALVLAVVPVAVLQPCLDQLLRAHYLITLSNLAMVAVPLTNVVVNGVLLIAGELTVATAVAAWVTGAVLSTLLLVGGVVRRLDGFGRFDPQLARRMLRFGLKAYFARVLLLGNYRMDTWLLGGIAGATQVGHYSVAVAWMEVLFFLPTAVMLAQRPDLARASPREAERGAALAVRSTMLVTFVLAVGMVALAPFLCVAVFGEEFRDSIVMLRILIVGAFGIVALKLLGNALTAQGKPMLETASAAVAFSVILILDVVLIPTHGGLGAAIASAFAYTVGGVAVAVIFTRALNGRLRDLLPHRRDIGWLRRRLLRAPPASEPTPQEIP